MTYRTKKTAEPFVCGCGKPGVCMTRWRNEDRGPFCDDCFLKELERISRACEAEAVVEGGSATPDQPCANCLDATAIAGGVICGACLEMAL